MTETLGIFFERWADLSGQGQHLARGCLFVPTPDPAPEAFAELSAVLIAPDGRRIELLTSVLQLVPGAGMALSVQDAEEARAALVQLGEGAPADVEGAGAARAQWDPAAESADEPSPPSDAPTGTAHDRVRALSTAEKLRLAVSGDRAERMLLLKDPNKTIHLHLLRNRGLMLDEVRYLAAYRQLNPEALKQISETNEWTQNPGVLLALVLNPKTPTTVALRLLPRVAKSELRRIAKSSSTPPAVVAAARKLVLG